jgi:uncharacterized membrane protein
MSPIEVGWDQNDQISEFTVTWKYAYWTSNTTESGDGLENSLVSIPSEVGTVLTDVGGQLNL